MWKKVCLGVVISIFVYKIGYLIFEYRMRQDINNFMLDQQSQNDLYELMGKVDTLFTTQGIRYWATGGTLLGAVRHGGLIPWDDDLDICVMKEDLPRILNLQQDLLDIGIEMSSAIGGLAFCKKDNKLDYFKLPFWIADCFSALVQGRTMPNYPTFPYMDVFVMTEENNLMVPNNKLVRKIFPAESYLKNNILHLTKVPFGPIHVYIPQEVDSYLTTTYGSDWATVGYITHNHKYNLQLSKPIIQTFA